MVKKTIWHWAGVVKTFFKKWQCRLNMMPFILKPNQHCTRIVFGFICHLHIKTRFLVIYDKTCTQVIIICKLCNFTIIIKKGSCRGNVIQTLNKNICSLKIFNHTLSYINERAAYFASVFVIYYQTWRVISFYLFIFVGFVRCTA